MADNLTTFIYRLSRNLGASNSWNPQGLPRPAKGLLWPLACYFAHDVTFLRHELWKFISNRLNNGQQTKKKKACVTETKKKKASVTETKKEEGMCNGDKNEEAPRLCVCSMQQSARIWSKIPEPPWGSGGGVRRSGVPDCSRFISELELEEEEGLVWSSTAITLVAFRDASFSGTRRSTQLSGASLGRDWMP
jgi:hypothetical protein